MLYVDPATSRGHAPRMAPRSRVLLACLLLTFTACGDDADGGETTSGETTSGETTIGDTTTTSADTSTDGQSSSSSADTTASTTGMTDTSETGSESGSTTGDASVFERFRLFSAAGPCPPEMDCDGYVELRADGTLEAELFGDLTKEVMMAEVTDEELADAIAVFADPMLVALLDGADPVCKPPTDIFESMELVLDGVTHDAGTTFCDQAPVAAARQVAVDLRMQYFGR